MLSEFIVNYWVWWYKVYFVDRVKSTYRVWLHLLGSLDLVPMVTNLFVPMYQDYTAIGRAVSLMVRLIWVLGGSIIQFIITLPLVMFIVLVFVFPLVPIVVLIKTLI